MRLASGLTKEDQGNSYMKLSCEKGLGLAGARELAHILRDAPPLLLTSLDFRQLSSARAGVVLVKFGPTISWVNLRH